jgi:hypothetical protein
MAGHPTDRMKKVLNGSGRLVPTRPTGIEYQVRYAIHAVPDMKQQHGRGMRPTRWAKCSLRGANVPQIPAGTYFLYTEDGRVHQVKAIDGQWHYLAVAA